MFLAGVVSHILFFSYLKNVAVLQLSAALNSEYSLGILPNIATLRFYVCPNMTLSLFPLKIDSQFLKWKNSIMEEISVRLATVGMAMLKTKNIQMIKKNKIHLLLPPPFPFSSVAWAAGQYQRQDSFHLSTRGAGILSGDSGASQRSSKRTANDTPPQISHFWDVFLAGKKYSRNV